MNSRLMYSRVMFETGRKSVVPGLFAFQWLKMNRPGQAGRHLGRAPAESCFLAPRTSSRIQSTCASRVLPWSVEISPSSGIRFHMSRK